MEVRKRHEAAFRTAGITVKGVAGSIGAAAVQNAAPSLEKAIKRAAPQAELEATRLSLEQQLAPIIQGLKTTPGAEGEPAEA